MSGLLDELHQSADPAPHEVEHRDGDVHPPVVVSNLVQESSLLGDRRDRGLGEEGDGDALHGLPAAFGQCDVAVELGELAARMSWSASAITVRVLPDPVAMTSSASRRLASREASTARIARSW